MSSSGLLLPWVLTKPNLTSPVRDRSFRLKCLVGKDFTVRTPPALAVGKTNKYQETQTEIIRDHMAFASYQRKVSVVRNIRKDHGAFLLLVCGEGC